MTRFGTIFMTLFLGLVVAQQTRAAEDPYERTAYNYTRYGHVTIQRAMSDPRVQQNSNANQAFVLSYRAWEEAWDGIIYRDHEAWFDAYVLNAYAWYYCEKAAKETGNVDLWFASDYCYQASAWCRFIYYDY